MRQLLLPVAVIAAAGGAPTPASYFWSTSSSKAGYDQGPMAGTRDWPQHPCGPLTKR